MSGRGFEKALGKAKSKSRARNDPSGSPVAPEGGVLDWPANLIAVSEGGRQAAGRSRSPVVEELIVRGRSLRSASPLALSRTIPDRLNGSFLVVCADGEP